MKKIIRAIVSDRIIYKIYTIKYLIKLSKTKRIFTNTKPSKELLSVNELRRLQNQYPFPPEYGYCPDSLDKRGKERAEFLLKQIPQESNNTYLEVGCWDGMVSYYLKKYGNIVDAIDIRDEGFDLRAKAEGVNFLKMDASHLKFEDHSYDVVFSYDTFEHFSDPVAVFSEMYRVTKPGGYIFLEIGPLYMSPKGLHAYRQITVPYCQLLFSKQTLLNFLEESNKGTLDFDHCNEWSLIQFRDLWESYSDKLQKISYIEIGDYNYLDLIQIYAPIFKNQTRCFDNLTCKTIKVLFRKN